MNKKLIILYIEMVELNNDENQGGVPSGIDFHRILCLCTECRMFRRTENKPPAACSGLRGEAAGPLEEKVTDRSEADEAAPMD